MKKRTITIAAVAVIALAIVVFNPYSERNVKRYVKNNAEQLTQYAQEISKNDFHVTDRYKAWKVKYYAASDVPVVNFDVFAFGLVPSSTYKGFYYSPKDIPAGFLGDEVEFVWCGDGWEWSQPDGDNTCYTEKIIDNWYWYEASF